MTKRGSTHKHWTAVSSQDFQYRVSSDFISQIENKLDEMDWTQSILAGKVGVTEGRISQIFNNPGNLTLRSMTDLAKAAGMKMSVLAYDDGDSENIRGPINSEVFTNCWNELGKPYDNWSFEDSITSYQEKVKTKVFSQVFVELFDTVSDWKVSSHFNKSICKSLGVDDMQGKLNFEEQLNEEEEKDKIVTLPPYELAA